MSHLPSPVALAEQVLHELGMNSPDEIDVDVIALHLGAITCYEELSGCDGRVLGRGDSAIITINRNVNPGRQRFTAAHEIGHWMYDRGEANACTAEKIEKAWGKSGRETRANRFAGALLLPDRMLQPYLNDDELSMFAEIGEIASRFQTSLSATSIKVTEKSPRPLMLVCMVGGQRHWVIRSRTVPESLWPVAKIHPHSRAARFLEGRATSAAGASDADVWFDNRYARHQEIYEDTATIAPNLSLTIISWPCEDMITEMLEED